jgi:hypothetical protein
LLPGDFSSSKTLEGDFIALASSYALICIDSLSPAMAVDYDSNSDRYAKPLQTLKRVAGKTGCGILLLTHDRKKTHDKSGEVIETDKRQMMRGSGALYAAFDYTYGAEQITDTSADWGQVKTRWGTRLPTHRVEVQGLAPEPTRLICRSAEELREERATEGLRKRGERVLQALGAAGGPLSGNALVEKLGGSRPGALGLLKALTEKGWILKSDEGFSLPVEHGSPSLRREKDAPNPPKFVGTAPPDPGTNVVPLAGYRKKEGKSDV